MEFLALLRILIGVPVVLVVPGFCWSLLFFPRDAADRLDGLERAALSIALSLVLVPITWLAVGWGLGVPVTWWSSLLILAALCAVPFGIARLLTARKAKTPEADGV